MRMAMTSRSKPIKTSVDLLTKAQAKVEHKRLAAGDRAARQALLSGRRADDFGRRIRRAAPALQRHRRALSRFRHGRSRRRRRSARRPRGGFTKVRHAVPMLSLDNAFAEEDVIDFVGRIRRFLKLVRRREDRLQRRAEDRRALDVAALRGRRTGHRGHARRRRRGEDVTANIRTLEDVPKKLKGRNVPEDLRGARRSLHDQARVPCAQQEAGRGGGAALRQSETVEDSMGGQRAGQNCRATPHAARERFTKCVSNYT